MFQILSNFFQMIGDTLSQIWHFFTNFVHSLITMIKMLPLVGRLFTQGISYLPPMLIVIGTMSLTIMILYLLIGRQPGGN